MTKTDLYIIKHNSKVFDDNTIVKCITCSDSGKCYLIEGINSDKREWIMYYDLYPVDWNNNRYNYKWFYDRKTEEIISKLIKSTKN